MKDFSENTSCLRCSYLEKCKLANDIKDNFGLKLKEMSFYCFKGKEEKEKMTKNDKIVKSLKFLVERYKNEIEQLKQNDQFKDDNKVQVVSILREIVQDIELLLDIK